MSSAAVSEKDSLARVGGGSSVTSGQTHHPQVAFSKHQLPKHLSTKGCVNPSAAVANADGDSPMLRRHQPLPVAELSQQAAAHHKLAIDVANFSTPSPHSDLDQFEDDNYLSQPWSEIFSMREFRSPEMWRSAVAEALAMLFFTWSTAVCAIVVEKANYAHGELVFAVLFGLLLSFFIVALVPTTGAHFSSTITVMALTTKFVTFPRALAYLCMQVLGSIAGATILLATITSPNDIPNCKFADNVPLAAVITQEFMFTAFTTFLVWYVAYDPRQQSSWWSAKNGFGGPFFCGMAAAVTVVMGSGKLMNGIGNPGVNPARCFGLAVASGKYQGLWVYLVVPPIAAFLQGTFYLLIPPHHTHYYRLQDARASHHANFGQPKSSEKLV